MKTDKTSWEEILKFLHAIAIIVLLAAVLTACDNKESDSTSNPAPTPPAHGEKSQAAFKRMRTIHWFDLNWSKEEVALNDTMTISGKFHVFAGWPETVDKPESSFLSFRVPESVFNSAGSWLDSQLALRSVGKPYDFKSGAEQPSSSHADVDRILAAMDSANIVFNVPSPMNLSETAKIQLLLSLQRSIEELSGAIVAAGEREGARIKISNRMEARLSGPNFQITAITPEEQAIGSDDTVEWDWEIKPTITGHHNLHLTLTAIFSIDGSPTRRAIKTYDRGIEVEVTAGQWVSDHFDKYWQWLLGGGILFSIGPWLSKKWKHWRSKKLWKRINNKNATSMPPDT